MKPKYHEGTTDECELCKFQRRSFAHPIRGLSTASERGIVTRHRNALIRHARAVKTRGETLVWDWM